MKQQIKLLKKDVKQKAKEMEALQLSPDATDKQKKRLYKQFLALNEQYQALVSRG